MHTKKMLRLDISNMVQAIDKLYLQIHESSFHQLELFSQVCIMFVRTNECIAYQAIHAFVWVKLSIHTDRRIRAF